MIVITARKIPVPEPIAPVKITFIMNTGEKQTTNMEELKLQIQTKAINLQKCMLVSTSSCFATSLAGEPET